MGVRIRRRERLASANDGSCDYLGCRTGRHQLQPDGHHRRSSCLFAGCTDSTAANFDADANSDDGSCLYEGCTNPVADNFDNGANLDDGSCILSGCTDPEADNYDDTANNDDGTCAYSGCTDADADNYDAGANVEDGSCLYGGCTQMGACNYDPMSNLDDGSCLFPVDEYGVDWVDCAGNCLNDADGDGVCDEEEVLGCTDPTSCNFEADATDDDGSCDSVSCTGCTDEGADNYDPTATVDDGSCVTSGCTYPTAANYNPDADLEDGSCTFVAARPRGHRFSATPMWTTVPASSWAARITLPSTTTGTLDNNTCQIFGCTNPLAVNFADNRWKTMAVASSQLHRRRAINYDALATVDNGSCLVLGCTDLKRTTTMPRPTSRTAPAHSAGVPSLCQQLQSGSHL